MAWWKVNWFVVKSKWWLGGLDVALCGRDVCFWKGETVPGMVVGRLSSSWNGCFWKELNFFWAGGRRVNGMSGSGRGKQWLEWRLEGWIVFGIGVSGRSKYILGGVGVV